MPFPQWHIHDGFIWFMLINKWFRKDSQAVTDLDDLYWYEQVKPVSPLLSWKCRVQTIHSATHLIQSTRKWQLFARSLYVPGKGWGQKEVYQENPKHQTWSVVLLLWGRGTSLYPRHGQAGHCITKCRLAGQAMPGNTGWEHRLQWDGSDLSPTPDPSWFWTKSFSLSPIFLEVIGRPASDYNGLNESVGKGSAPGPAHGVKTPAILLCPSVYTDKWTASY